MVTHIFDKLDRGLQRGDEVLVDREWYPVIGYVGTHHPITGRTGSIFTNKPIGKYEPWLGYRIDFALIEDCRRPVRID
ncbi:hypothetical protein XM25_08030 [Devosia sp. H5989]|nr:hypothetical protein XM25_08030 [Devosia sp. H5989]